MGPPYMGPRFRFPKLGGPSVLLNQLRLGQVYLSNLYLVHRYTLTATESPEPPSGNMSIPPLQKDLNRSHNYVSPIWSLVSTLHTADCINAA